MKLVDSSIIAKAEAVFSNELSSSLDLAIIGRLFRNHYNMRLSGPAEFQDLNVVVHNDQIAFKFDYTALAYFSIYMDRSGAFLKMEQQGDQIEEREEGPGTDDHLVKAGVIRDRATRLAETIAGAIEIETLAKLIEINSHAKLNGRLDFMGARFAIHQKQPIYNLIYQGEVALSFFVDDRGRFLDIADTPAITAQNCEETAEPGQKGYALLEDIIVDEERGLIIGGEPDDDIELDAIDDEELMRLEDILEEDLDAQDRDGASN